LRLIIEYQGPPSLFLQRPRRFEWTYNFWIDPDIVPNLIRVYFGIDLTKGTRVRK